MTWCKAKTLGPFSFPPNPLHELGEPFHTCTCDMGSYCRAATLCALSAFSELQVITTVIIQQQWTEDSLGWFYSDEHENESILLGIQIVSLGLKTQGRDPVLRPLRFCRAFISVNKIIFLSVSFRINISGGGLAML